MPNRNIDQVPEGVPEFEGILEAVLLQALNEAKDKLEAGEEVEPFTALAVGETLFIETIPAQDAEEIYSLARHTVEHAKGALAYALCYDGFLDTDQGEMDALIAEGGIPGAESGHAIGYIYEVPEDPATPIAVEGNPVYIGPAPNFMEFALDFGDSDEDGDGFVDYESYEVVEGYEEDYADSDSEEPDLEDI